MFKKLVKKAKSTAKKAVKKAKSTAKKAVKKVTSTAKKVATTVKRVVKPKPKPPVPARTAKPVFARSPQPAPKPKPTSTLKKIEQSKAYRTIIGDPKVFPISRLVDDALTFTAMLPGAGALTKGLGSTGRAVATKFVPKVSGGASKAVTRVLPRRLPGGVKYIPPAKVGQATAGVRTAAGATRQPITTAARRALPGATQGTRAALRPAATQTTQAARVALQPTAVTTTGTRAVAPAIQSAATGGMRAGATQAARAAQAGARSLGSRVAGAGAAAGAGLASGARAVGSGLKTAGQWAGRNWKPIAGLGAAGGLAYGLWPRGDAMDEEMEGQQMAQEEPQMTPEGWGSGGYGGYGGGGGYGGMSGMGGIGMGGMSDAMPDWGQLQNELFSAIDSAAGQNSAMTISWLNQMTDTLNQLEQDIIEQYRQQGQEIDPATQAALKQIRDQVAFRRQGLMEEMNRRGVLQSGIWLEEENRLLSGQLNAEEQLLAGRLSDLQNRLTDTMQNFAQQRMNIMGTAWQNEMDTTRWAGQQKVGVIQDISQRQDDWNRWWSEMGLKSADLGIKAYKANKTGSSGGRSNSATKQFIQQIPSYGSLQDALQDFNNYKGDMMAQGADVAAVLQNIYAYFGS